MDRLSQKDYITKHLNLLLYVDWFTLDKNFFSEQGKFSLKAVVLVVRHTPHFNTNVVSFMCCAAVLCSIFKYRKCSTSMHKYFFQNQTTF